MFIVGRHRMTSHCTISDVPQIGDAMSFMGRHLPPSPRITRVVRGLPGFRQGSTLSRWAARPSSGLDPFNCRPRWVRLGGRLPLLEPHRQTCPCGGAAAAVPHREPFGRIAIRTGASP